MKYQNPFDKLRDILLDEDRKEKKKVDEKIKIIESEITVKEKFEPKVEPIIDKKLQYIRDNFPELYGPAITSAIKLQIKNSRDEVIDALYPIMGKMIKKYIIKEFEVLNEKIDKQFHKIFSWKYWWSMLKGTLTGSSPSEVMVREMLEPQIEEIFVIEQGSGILQGSYSKSNKLDKDLIAGMLTAIKSFVQDAFEAGEQSLDKIEYEHYRIIIKSLQKYYVAVVVSGPLSEFYQSKIDELILDFIAKIQGHKKGDEPLKLDDFISTHNL